jgi:DNA-binding GntR family transcriptional regulator
VIYVFRYLSGFGLIESKTLRQKVYELLKEKILTAEILPGQKISLRNLAVMLGVSLMPVREALWQLESEKVVEEILRFR